MIRPSDIGDVTWEVLTAAHRGDAATLRRLLDADPARSREGYWYTPPLHFAAREGHADAVRLLLEAGADPEWNGYYDASLIEMARERGHEDVASLLEQARDARGRAAPDAAREDHEIHRAAEAGDVRRMRRLIDVDPTLVHRGDRAGGTPLHRAVVGRSRRAAGLLLDRGADIHAIHGVGLGAARGFGARDVQAIDLAIWGGLRRSLPPPRWRMLVCMVQYWLRDRYRRNRQGPRDIAMARFLLRRLVAAGVRVPRVVTGCQSYLMEQPDMLRTLLENGMHPDTCNWQNQTMLHLLCGPDSDGKKEQENTLRAGILLDAGADISAREEQCAGTPLALAARNNNPGMVRFLLARGAPTNLPDDKPWSTPLAWATRRGHAEIVRMLREAGAGL